MSASILREGAKLYKFPLTVMTHEPNTKFPSVSLHTCKSQVLELCASRNQDEFYFLFKRNVTFGQNSEILGLHFCAKMKLRTQSATLGKLSKNHLLLLIEMSSMYETWDCFKFHDPTLT